MYINRILPTIPVDMKKTVVFQIMMLLKEFLNVLNSKVDGLKNEIFHISELIYKTNYNTDRVSQFKKIISTQKLQMLRIKFLALLIQLQLMLLMQRLRKLRTDLLKKTLWPHFMDGVKLPQGQSHFEEAVYFLPLNFQKFLVLILLMLEG